MKNLIPRSLALGLLAGACMAGAAQTLEVSGSTTVEKRFFGSPAVATIHSATGLSVHFKPAGSGAGLVDLVEGKASVAASSEPLAETIESARKAARTPGPFAAPAHLQYHEIGRDRIVVIVHPDNPVGALTLEQLRDLNTGKARNWKAVGGADRPVQVVTGSRGSGTRAMFQKQVMGGAPYADGALEMAQTEREIFAVTLNRGAIGAVSEALARVQADKVRVVPGPEIGRPLGLITLGPPSTDARKLIDHLRASASAQAPAVR